MVVQWKAIIPPPLKLNVIKAGIEAALDELAAEINQDFGEFVKTWNNQPEFSIEERKGYRKIFASDDILFYVNNGTKPHEIRPRNAKVLVFQSGYSAKTKPGSFSSRGGGSSGPLVFSKAVQHPGTEAREADKAIKDDVQKDAQKIVEPYLVKSAKKAGL